MLNTPGDDAHDGDLELDFVGLEPDDGPDPDGDDVDRGASPVPAVPTGPVGMDNCVPLDDEREQVGYELFAWEPEELDALDDAIHQIGVPHEWESDGYELVVHLDDEETVDELLPRVRAAAGEEPDDSDATDIEDMADLFVAVRKLRRDPAGSGVPGFLDAAEGLGSDPPYGLDDRAWSRVTGAVDALIDGYHTEAPIDVLRNLVDDLHRHLRPLI